MITKRIGEILIERGLINAKQLEKALAHQQEQGGLLGQILVQMGFVTEEEVALTLTAQYGFPYLPLENYEIDTELVASVPEQVARQYCLMPVDRIGNALTLAMADPSDVKAIEKIELLTKCVVQTFVSTPTDITKAIDRHYKKRTIARPAPAEELPPEANAA
jgi:type IV pilus assembly protein PilB